MTRSSLYIVLVATFLSFCTLYTPQPLLPLFGQTFSVSPLQTTALMTLTLAPLGLAPVLYGYFLQAIPARSMLRIALVLLAVDQLLVLLVTEFWQLLLLRFVQGLLMPAIFTAAMTYCSSMSGSTRVRSVMALYIATTIVGGLLSRVLSGVLAEFLGWQWVFGVLGLALLIPAWLAGRIDADAQVNFGRLDARAISRAIKTPSLALSYLSLFLVFFVFSGILNLLPYRLHEIVPGISPMAISMVYCGYVAGLAAAMFSSRLVEFWNERKILLSGIVLQVAGMISYLSSEPWVLFGYMLVHAAGFFLVHSVLSGLVNVRATEHKGVVNGLYVSVYYISGTLGAWLPFYGYTAFGWNTLLLAFILVLAVAGWLVWKLPRS